MSKLTLDAAQFGGLLRGSAVDADELLAQVEHLASTKKLTPAERAALVDEVQRLRQPGQRNLVGAQVRALFGIIESRIDGDGNGFTITTEERGKKTTAGLLVDAVRMARREYLETFTEKDFLARFAVGGRFDAKQLDEKRLRELGFSQGDVSQLRRLTAAPQTKQSLRELFAVLDRIDFDGNQLGKRSISRAIEDLDAPSRSTVAVTPAGEALAMLTRSFVPAPKPAQKAATATTPKAAPQPSPSAGRSTTDPTQELVAAAAAAAAPLAPGAAAAPRRFKRPAYVNMQNVPDKDIISVLRAKGKAVTPESIVAERNIGCQIAVRRDVHADLRLNRPDLLNKFNDSYHAAHYMATGEDSEGRVSGPPERFTQGVEYLRQLLREAPTVGGVSYQRGKPGSGRNNHDGITDHFVKLESIGQEYVDAAGKSLGEVVDAKGQALPKPAGAVGTREYINIVDHSAPTEAASRLRMYIDPATGIATKPGTARYHAGTSVPVYEREYQLTLFWTYSHLPMENRAGLPPKAAKKTRANV